jgi:hypothetical protein
MGTFEMIVLNGSRTVSSNRTVEATQLAGSKVGPNNRVRTSRAPSPRTGRSLASAMSSRAEKIRSTGSSMSVGIRHRPSESRLAPEGSVVRCRTDIGTSATRGLVGSAFCSMSHCRRPAATTAWT